MIQVMKRKEHVVREMVEKKNCLNIYVLKEKVLNNRKERTKEELKAANELI